MSVTYAKNILVVKTLNEHRDSFTLDRGKKCGQKHYRKLIKDLYPIAFIYLTIVDQYKKKIKFFF